MNTKIPSKKSWLKGVLKIAIVIVIFGSLFIFVANRQSQPTAQETRMTLSLQPISSTKEKKISIQAAEADVLNVTFQNPAKN